MRDEELLSADDLALLSPQAVRVYVYVWNTMDHRRVHDTHLQDDSVSRQSRVTLNALGAAQGELVRHGFMRITQRPAADSVVTGAHYRLIVPEG